MKVVFIIYDQMIESLLHACSILGDPCVEHAFRIVLSHIQTLPLVVPMGYQEESLC